MEKCEIWEGESSTGKKANSGAFGGQAAPEFSGVAAPLRHEFSCRRSPEWGTFGEPTHNTRRNSMPIVKKAPEVMSREVKLEQPVNQLLEDYARFIESSPDHVVNSVLKKLWRDQDYRKWRDARRSSQSANTVTAQTSDSSGRA
jgi:hypothetical protein